MTETKFVRLDPERHPVQRHHIIVGDTVEVGLRDVLGEKDFLHAGQT